MAIGNMQGQVVLVTGGAGGIGTGICTRIAEAGGTVIMTGTRDAAEMEAAALFAVARFRKVVLGQILYAGDDVSGTDWDDRDWDKLARTRSDLFELAVDACRRLPTGG